jgi:hypothetical protein
MRIDHVINRVSEHVPFSERASKDTQYDLTAAVDAVRGWGSVVLRESLAVGM